MYELRFHGETRRWRVYDGAKVLYPLHCGDPLLFELGGVFYPASLELDTEWYVAFGGTKFWLHTKIKYRVLLMN
ncbi:DUF5348 domain-containing protein [Ferviditalea candida]|uniref:DUF5348 domain-containing protein n=1 Tax=Ferviditalea candida TaxID=3108399 RepID=A0ABU5ZQB1_9BACL|nr:DUF5348 domain-containing protein [Paenibacillaceae bacterium T2]